MNITFLKSLYGWVSRNILFAAWVIAGLSILGSISLSEVWGFEPCRLCWYQRYLLFAALIILSIAEYKKLRHFYKYILPITLIGWAIAFYQTLLQWGVISESLTCSVDASCALAQVNLLGFITIPLMSLMVFTVLSGLMIIQYKQVAIQET